MKLMIIESPGKRAHLLEILGGDWKVVASVGHIRDLPAKDFGVQAPDYVPEYEFIPPAPIPDQPGKFFPGGKERVERIAALVKEADAVYLATDPDREGESISWHLQQSLKLVKPFRVAFNEITDAAVKAALASPRTIDVKLVAAQEARRVLDRMVGYTVSPELCNLTGLRLSAGRVQSVAVRLVVDRERQIKAFKSTNHFGAQLIFADAKTNSQWSADWLTKPNFASDDEPYFMDKAFAAAVAEVKMAIVKSFNESVAKRGPPAPFTTSTFQQAASVALGLDPKAAMDAAQKLYERGHISYHRTDNPNISTESWPHIKAVAAAMGLDMCDEIRTFKAPDGAQVGHPAITPTHWEAEEAGETEEQKAVYKLIRIRAIACQLADARYAVRTVRLQAARPVGGREVDFEGRGRTLVYGGWLKLLAGDQTEEEEDNKEAPSNPIPFCQPGESLDVASGKVLDMKTRAPSRYTLATLVKKLESEGIGRPATYATIMDNIVTRKYVSHQKKFLVPTETGELIVDSLAGKFEFMDLSYTRDVEEDLDRIAQGTVSYKEVIADVDEKLKSEITLFRGSATPKHPCPKCGKALRRITGKTGHFWGCSAYPECSASFPDDNGKPQEESKHCCPKCGKPLAHRVKKGKGGYDFWGCTGFKDGCKASYNNKDDKPDFVNSK